MVKQLPDRYHYAKIPVLLLICSFSVLIMNLSKLDWPLLWATS